ncbi:MAG: hypothetical protein U1F36_23440 [Planctomycetota bacterium]
MNTRTLTLPLSLLLVTASVALPRTTLAQISPYVVMAGDQSHFHVIQSGVLLRTWSVPPGTAQYQYALVVHDTIRTMGANVGDIGAQYDLNGTDLGARFTHPTGPSRAWDGTTDGVHHYTIDTAGGVYRLDRDWSNPVFLFSAGGIGALTYDPTNDSLWVSQFGTSTITDYTMTGSVISSFSTGHTQNMALALDDADGTLWLHDRNVRGTFEQWTKSGVMLNRIAIAGMATENALGGEMQRLIGNCTFRNGSGVNPADFTCLTRPALGGTWTTSYNSNTNTVATVLIVGLGGPATGPNLGYGEWLVALNPAPVVIAGNGNYSLPIPNSANLAGLHLSTQGARLDFSSLVLLNAQDIVIGQ